MSANGITKATYSRTPAFLRTACSSERDPVGARPSKTAGQCGQRFSGREGIEGAAERDSEHQ